VDLGDGKIDGTVLLKLCSCYSEYAVHTNSIQISYVLCVLQASISASYSAVPQKPMT
jgi:hypothetical protein